MEREGEEEKGGLVWKRVRVGKNGLFRLSVASEDLSIG